MRSRTKIFRLTELQLKQLEQYIQRENTNFTDFIHSLIAREVMHDAVTVQQTHDEIKPARTKIKTVVEVVKRYQKLTLIYCSSLPKSATTLIRLHVH
jgi:replication-associated recombination protein RarA